MKRFCATIAVLAAVCVLGSGKAWAAKGGNSVDLSAYSFEEIDKDRDGKITISEFCAVFKNTEAATKMFRKGDTDGDKHLSKKEFDALKGAKAEQTKEKKKKK